jgi:hypothetical protein
MHAHCPLAPHWHCAPEPHWSGGPFAVHDIVQKVSDGENVAAQIFASTD